MLITLHNVISRLYYKHWKCLNSGGVSQTLSANAEIIDMGGSKMTKYEKISLAINLALLILSLLAYIKMLVE